MFFFPWLNIWLSSMISLPAFSDFLTNALPKRWERLGGVSFSQIATPAGRIALVYIHPLISFSAVVWAIARGSDCVSGEIGRGTMEMLLAQPVRRATVYATQALVTVLGSVALAGAVWCGTAIGVTTVPLPGHVSATLFIPPAINLFGLMVCMGGMSCARVILGESALANCRFSRRMVRSIDAVDGRWPSRRRMGVGGLPIVHECFQDAKHGCATDRSLVGVCQSRWGHHRPWLRRTATCSAWPGITLLHCGSGYLQPP